MTRNESNNLRGNNQEGGYNRMQQSQFGIEEVGKLVGSAVASAIKEYKEQDEQIGHQNSSYQRENDSNRQSNEIQNSNNGNNIDGDGEELRRNKDGSIDKRQFNNGQGDNSDVNDWKGKASNGDNDESYLTGIVKWYREDKGVGQITTDDGREILINSGDIKEGELIPNEKIKLIINNNDELIVEKAE